MRYNARRQMGMPSWVRSTCACCCDQARSLLRVSVCKCAAIRPPQCVVTACNGEPTVHRTEQIDYDARCSGPCMHAFVKVWYRVQAAEWNMELSIYVKEKQTWQTGDLATNLDYRYV